MKYIKLLLLIVVVILSSCEEERIIFDGKAYQTPYLSFEKASYNLEVVEDATGSLDILINFSNTSSQDRVIDINVILPLDPPIATTYTVPTTVTVPANEYTGTLTLTGDDTGNGGNDVTTSPKTIEIEFADSTDYIKGPGITVNIYQVCPFPDTYFVGDYIIGDVNGVFGGENFDSGTVEVVPGGSSTSRTFDASFFGTSQNITLNLVCNELIFATTFNTGFTAAPPGLDPLPIIIKPASNNTSTYDISSDAFFIIDYDNEAGAYGTFPGSFFLQKAP